MTAAHQLFPLRLPGAFLDEVLQTPGQQALLSQFLPDPRETRPVEGYQTDPVGDHDASPLPGVIHKYQGRLLLVATGACAVHCRYCFRRHFPYNASLASRDNWREALAYIDSHPDVSEIILSGGDPLMLEPRRLRDFTDQLAKISHVRRLRIHSRVPVVLPDRIDDQLQRWLQQLPWPTSLVIHANHPDELTRPARKLLGELSRIQGLTLLNQAVLLKGVNDDPETLCRLSEDFYAAGVLPYYLHLLDPVQGAAHFAVDETLARAVMQELRRRLPGYLVPRMVRETAGAEYKLPLS